MTNPTVTVTQSFGLTDREILFVKEFLSSGQKKESAEKAGYANPAYSAFHLLRLPHIAEALQYELNRLLRVEDAPRARRIMMDLLEDERSGARVRADIGKTILNLAGFVAPSKAADEAPEKQLSEMSQDELHTAMGKSAADVERLERELASRATQVNAPIQADTPQEPNSFLE